jgi:hypothetical protein
MSQTFTQLSAGCGKAVSSAPKAIAPVVNQLKHEIAVGAGVAYVDLLAPIASGQCAAAAGSVQNKGCAAIRLEISYLNDPNACDSDQDGCSDSALLPLEVVVDTFDIPANSGIELFGLVKGIKVATLDEFGGVLTANTAIQTVLWNSAYQPDGCGCVLVP